MKGRSGLGFVNEIRRPQSLVQTETSKQKKPHNLEKEKHVDEQRVGLRRLNAAACLLHFFTGIVVITAGNRSLHAMLFVTNMKSLNRERGDWLLRPDTLIETTSVHLIVAIAVFEFVTAFFHFGAGVMWRRKYEEWVFVQHKNPSRWIEYSITASVMIFLLGVFFGHVNLYVQILLVSLTAITMGFGYLAEEASSQGNTPLAEKAHLLGYFPQVVVWSVVTTQFVRYAAVSQLDSAGDTVNEMPKWVYALFTVEILLFCSFAFVQALQIRYWRGENYVRAEKLFIALSYISKASLAFLIIGGTINLKSSNT